MALGMEVGLGPGDFVFDGDPELRTRTPPPSFWPMFIFFNAAKRLDE